MKRALIIESDEMVREMLQFYFEEWGIEAEVADDFLPGLKHLFEKDFDIFVSELHLPHGTGLDVLMWARAQRRQWRGCPSSFRSIS